MVSTIQPSQSVQSTPMTRMKRKNGDESGHRKRRATEDEVRGQLSSMSLDPVDSKENPLQIVLRKESPLKWTLDLPKDFLPSPLNELALPPLVNPDAYALVPYQPPTWSIHPPEEDMIDSMDIE
jgi:hypothetical protein